MDAFSSVSVILFGVGGVGSWCAEGLVRSGISKLTIVDSDRVSVTNVNRQLMATSLTPSGRLSSTCFKFFATSTISFLLFLITLNA